QQFQGLAPPARGGGRHRRSNRERLAGDRGRAARKPPGRRPPGHRERPRWAALRPERHRRLHRLGRDGGRAGDTRAGGALEKRMSAPRALSTAAFATLLLIALMMGANHVAARIAFNHGADVATAVVFRSGVTALVLIA